MMFQVTPTSAADANSTCADRGSLHSLDQLVLGVYVYCFPSYCLLTPLMSLKGNWLTA